LPLTMRGGHRSRRKPCFIFDKADDGGGFVIPSLEASPWNLAVCQCVAKIGVFSVRSAYHVEWEHQHERKLRRTSSLGSTEIRARTIVEPTAGYKQLPHHL
jgi:hypothetical protein